MLPILSSLTDAEHWRMKRAENMGMARRTKELGAVNGVAFWVNRARRAHNIAMGREAIIKNFLIINGNESWQGDVYASQNT